MAVLLVYLNRADVDDRAVESRLAQQSLRQPNRAPTALQRAS